MDEVDDRAKAILSGLDDRIAALSSIRDDSGRLGNVASGDRYRRWKDVTTQFIRANLGDEEADRFNEVRPVRRLARTAAALPWWETDGVRSLAFLTALVRDLKERPEDVLRTTLVAKKDLPVRRRQAKKRPQIRLFISHSSADAGLAGALIGLLRSALNLPSAAIRCTSVTGYRLPAGADTDDQIRTEVQEAEVVLGIISEWSLDSLYVAFELGARWGAGKALIPLMARGVKASRMKGPLGGKNALSADEAGQLHQLVSDIGKDLAISPNSPASYQADIEAVLALPAAAEPAAGKAGVETSTLNANIPGEEPGARPALRLDYDPNDSHCHTHDGTEEVFRVQVWNHSDRRADNVTVIIDEAEPDFRGLRLKALPEMRTGQETFSVASAHGRPTAYVAVLAQRPHASYGHTQILRFNGAQWLPQRTERLRLVLRLEADVKSDLFELTFGDGGTSNKWRVVTAKGLASIVKQPERKGSPGGGPPPSKDWNWT